MFVGDKPIRSYCAYLTTVICYRRLSSVHGAYVNNRRCCNVKYLHCTYSHFEDECYVSCGFAVVFVGVGGVSFDVTLAMLLVVPIVAGVVVSFCGVGGSGVLF